MAPRTDPAYWMEHWGFSAVEAEQAVEEFNKAMGEGVTVD